MDNEGSLEGISEDMALFAKTQGSRKSPLKNVLHITV